ncbi:MAG: aminotransferase class I/II-fold pyridoxal phosphate-dependent enzyme [Solirubrobacterales bacterium]
MAQDGVQPGTPYLDALREYAARSPGRFHVPGHKGGAAADPKLIEAFGERALALDIPALTEGIDAGPEPTPFQQAQRLAAAAWGAARTWFLINGASQGNHAACVALAHGGDQVVVQRNVHSSTIDGLVVSGLRPAFVAPEIDPELGIAHCVTPEALDRALAGAPGATGAMIVSPTYFGAVADVEGLARVTHERGVPLVVDEAWGAHLAFGQSLPAHALECGADLVVSSTHKIIGSFTQSAMLHLGRGARLDEHVVDRAITLLESTSPSSLLSGSLDAARAFAATHGARMLEGTVRALAAARQAIRRIPGLEVLDERLVERAGVHAYDPLRLVVDVRGTGVSGYRLAQLMRERDIHPELAGENVIVAVFGMGESASDNAARLVEALEQAVTRLPGERDVAGRELIPPPPLGPLEMTPRDAFLGAQEVVPVEEAVGRIAAESLAAYPPGIPNVLPGERLTAETWAYVQAILAHGGSLRGASDRTLRTARVAVEAS